MHEVLLTGRLRCNGGLGYMAFVDRLMSDRPEPPDEWLDGREYDFRLFGDPGQMENALRAEADGETPRRVLPAVVRSDARRGARARRRDRAVAAAVERRPSALQSR